MRALNLGLFAVIGGIAGASACADDPEPPEIIPGPNMPFPTGGANTGGVSTGGSISGSGGSKNSGSGSGGRSTGGTSSKVGCPTNEPDDGDACTVPTDGTTLKCVFEVTTTCTCKRSAFSGKAAWDCVTSSGVGTGGKASTGGRAAFSQGGVGQGGSTGGGAAKAGGFGFP